VLTGRRLRIDESTAMKIPSVLLFVLSVRCLGGSILIENENLPDVVEYHILSPAVIESGFYPLHAPPGRYTQQQIDTALAGLAPLEKGILSSTSEHRFVGEVLVSTTTIMDPNGSLQGVDFTGNPLDHETWIAAGPANLTLDIRLQSKIRRESRDFITREYVRKPRPGSDPIGSTVDIDTQYNTTPTDLVETVAPVLKYSPATVPAFIPAELVQQALAGVAPGQEVALATSYGVLPLGMGYGAFSETVNSYNAQFGTDYIGDPEDYFTWIAIGSSSIQVSVYQVEEEGRRFLDQTLQYRLIAPDSTGSVIVNPEITVVTEVTDTTRTWDKIYFTSTHIPAEVDPADASALSAKILPGTAALLLHTVVDTPATTTRTSAKSINAHGAVQGVDYSGNPANPATWTALTANDVIADRLDTVSLTTPTAADHRIHTLYREASTDPGETGQLHLVENNVVGRDIVCVTRSYLNRSLDPLVDPLPAGITAGDIQRALTWANPGETVIVGQTRDRALTSTQTSPLTDIIDTNGWIHGTHFLGNPSDMNTWYAAGHEDVHIDIYHRVSRTRNYDEVVINHLVTAPVAPAATPPALLSVNSGPPRSLNIAWHPPYGMEFEVQTSSNLSGFLSVPGRYKADGRELRHTQFFAPSQPAGFLRVKRR
jgi:hypothetical protein